MDSEMRFGKRQKQIAYTVDTPVLLMSGGGKFPRESIEFSRLKLKDTLIPLIYATPKEEGGLMEIKFVVVDDTDKELHVIFDQLVNCAQLEGALSFETLQQIITARYPQCAAAMCIDMFIAKTGKLIIELGWGFGIGKELYFELKLPGLEKAITVTVPFDDKAKKFFEVI